jgi:hypothetical protein
MKLDVPSFDSTYTMDEFVKFLKVLFGPIYFGLKITFETKLKLRALEIKFKLFVNFYFKIIW